MHTHTCVFTYDLEHPPSLRDILSLIAVRRSMTGFKLDVLIQIRNKNSHCLGSSRIYSRTRQTNECNSNTDTHLHRHVHIQVYMHLHIRIHLCTRTCIRTRIRTHTRACKCKYTHTYTHAHTHAHTYTHAHAHARTRTSTNTHTHTHIHTSGFVIIWSIAKTARDTFPLLFATTNNAS